MFEHVGYKNYRQFMEVVNSSLKPDAHFLLHIIASKTSTHHGDPWFDQYIFPNGMLPSIEQPGKACEKLLVMDDWHNISIHFDRTLTSWFSSFDQHWPELQEEIRRHFLSNVEILLPLHGWRFSLPLHPGLAYRFLKERSCRRLSEV